MSVYDDWFAHFVIVGGFCLFQSACALVIMAILVLDGRPVGFLDSYAIVFALIGLPTYLAGELMAKRSEHFASIL